ncbi:hypothetical protein [Pedobacter chitinilyticus]|uniref:TFIIB-type zinc ribbon-containing protein n=1 Tax=Pedobacter chitinilyticus TaxID=2233776 RepID=A0A3S4RTZ4_9SPHI|nr:hypothetical protein [Pedobacter chitinilyticus]RWU10884.1 hypothetical protein DPV69_06015 [Pedobacter chitinilyticus]
MTAQKRFQDENKRLSEFETEVWVQCPLCSKKAVAKVDHQLGEAKLLCSNCGHVKTTTTETVVFGVKAKWIRSAEEYFGVQMWLQHPFKNNTFWAYNPAHLAYLEQYIAATLREHKDRSHFTLLEKLPKFYHESKNRTALLKIIAKLKSK